MDDLLKAQRHTVNHRAEIEASRLCGCYHCRQIFPPDEIVAWTGWDEVAPDEIELAEGKTALCPRCGSETVIGDRSGFPIEAGFLNRMHEAWSEKTLVYRPKT